MNLLVLHTTAADGAVAARVDERVASVSLPAAAQHARTLLGAVTEVLTLLNADLAALDGVCVTRGPGSFTGIRIGLATAQGLAAARGWEVWTCDSLAAEAWGTIASRARPSGRAMAPTCAVVLDARRGEVFSAAYRIAGARLGTLLEPACSAPEAARDRLASLPPPWFLAGAGAGLVGEALRSAGASCQIVAPPQRPVIARALLDLTVAGGCEKIGPDQLTPLYLRVSDAETKRQRHRAG